MSQKCIGKASIGKEFVARHTKFGFFFGKEVQSQKLFFYFFSSKEVLPVGIYLLKVNNRNTRTRCGICLKLTIKTPK